jgi:hypothetical protein
MTDLEGELCAGQVDMSLGNGLAAVPWIQATQGI